jgi:hypothetical protein
MKARCDDCGTVWDISELDEPVDLWERVDEGNDTNEVLGQCPIQECGALCYESKDSQ